MVCEALVFGAVPFPHVLQPRDSGLHMWCPRSSGLERAQDVACVSVATCPCAFQLQSGHCRKVPKAAHAGR